MSAGVESNRLAARWRRKAEHDWAMARQGMKIKKDCPYEWYASMPNNARKNT